MPRPALRSKSQKRKKLKTPGHQNVIHYWRKKPSKAQCSLCKKPLQSIPRVRQTKMKKIDKTARSVNRLESGRYCPKCLQKQIKESVWQAPDL